MLYLSRMLYWFLFVCLVPSVFSFTSLRNHFSLKNKQQLRMVFDPMHVTDFISQADTLLHVKANLLASHSFLTSDEAVGQAAQVVTDASQYSKVDKTGFIGFFANLIEIGIDFAHTTLQSVGVKYSYGFAIVLFTLLIKVLTLPLTTTQLESTTKMQKLQPLQLKIQAKYANDEQTKNQLVAQLFQTANVNPLAGCLPALVQIPVFISLYRALQNLVAENKLDEPFLWIPDLEGPVYTAPASQSLDWIKSAFTGNPSLGWHDTLAFLTLPAILYVTQSISSKVLQPPKDPNKVLTEQELFSQGLVNNIPFIIAFFSLNVPSGLAVYWVVNNILTTVVTLAVKQQFKDEQLPPEVVSMMASIEADAGAVAKRMASSSAQELRRPTMFDDKPRTSGFGKIVVDTSEVKPSEEVAAADAEDAGAVESVQEVTEEEGSDEVDSADSSAGDKKKRSKRTKAARRK